MEQGPPQEPPQPPPIPDPSGASGASGVCPNCGQPTVPRASHCPRCGARLAAPGFTVLGVLGMIALGILALGLGSFGACSLVFAASFVDGSAASVLGLLFLALGGGALYLAFVCVRRIVESMRSRRDRPQ